MIVMLALLSALQDPGALRAALPRYQEWARQGGWPASLAPRLAAEGYDTSTGLRATIERFQALHGLEPDGIVGPATRAQLEVSPAARAQQIELTLARWRGLPRSLGPRYIIVNSAAFTLELVEQGVVTFSTRAVVGHPDTPTPVLSSAATHVVFRPVWKVPRTIAEQELLPRIRRDPGYRARHGFRLLDDSSLTQEPGPDNPLGGMKLVFANPFNVSIHDTPARSLFSKPVPAQSRLRSRTARRGVGSPPPAVVVWRLRAEGDAQWTTTLGSFSGADPGVSRLLDGMGCRRWSGCVRG